MKRKLWIAAALALFIAALYLGTAAADPGGNCGADVTWQLDTYTGVLTISGSGPMWDFSEDNRPGWYNDFGIITSVVIEEGVTTIGDYAFYRPGLGSSPIADVSIPGSVRTIGKYAFAGCASITALEIPDTVTSIGTGAFYYCDGLADENGFIIFRNVLYGYTGFAAHVTVPEGITAISGSAFRTNVNLTEITLPDSLITIHEYAFFACHNLASVTLPEQLTSIQKYAFSGCTGLEIVVFPENLAFIGPYAFEYCTNLGEAVVYNPETVIAGTTFDQCGYFRISGYSSSTACTFAQGHGIHFEPLDGQCGDNLTWTLSRGVLTVSGTGPMWDFYDELTPGWLVHARKITSIVIEDGVTTVGAVAFQFYTKPGESLVTDVRLPEGLTSIGEYAFSTCSNLTELDIPDSVISVESGALSECYGLADENGFVIFRDELYCYAGSSARVTIPAYITAISGSAFVNCENLTEVILPSGLNTIRDHAFYKCTNLSSVALPEGLTSIQYDAFEFCRSLERIELPESLLFIGSAAFCGCESLTEAAVYNPETVINNTAFLDCGNLTLYGFSSSTADTYAQGHEIPFVPLDGECGDGLTWTLIRGTLRVSGTGPMWDFNDDDPAWIIHSGRITSVVLEEGVKSVGDYAFYFLPMGTSLIIDVSLPASLDSIGDYAFAGCSSLTALDIPYSVRFMGSGALYRCDGLADGNGFILFRNTLYGYTGSSAHVTVPAGVTEISGSAFKDCLFLEEITLPSGLNNIREYAFDNCACLASITLPQSLTAIQRYAFCWCTGLESVTIPGNVIFVGPSAFTHCTALTEAVILNPDAVIGLNAFGDCPGLSVCGMLPSTAKTYAEGHSIPFTAIGGPCGDNVTWSWNRSTDVVTFSGTGPMWDYTWENHSPLYYHSDMTVAVIEDGVTSVGAFLFHGCHKLVHVSIPNSVSVLGDSAFTYCSLLDNVVIPYGVTSIRGLFTSCTSLAHITLPSSLVKIGQSAFYGCTALENLDFVPDSVTTIETNAFYGCTGLTSVFVPRGIRLIDDYVFRDCTNLTSIAIHRDVTRIDRYAFDGDTKLKSVYYEGVRSEWNAIAIDPDHNDPLLSAVLYCKLAVTFDTVGGYPEIEPQAVNWEELPTEPEAPQKIGARFAGWYTDPNYTERYNFLIPVTADMTLYASWAYPAPAGVLKLPAILTSIEDQAFAGVGAEGVIIPDSVNFIPDSAFEGSGVLYVFGFPGSAAETFALSHPSLIFVPIDQNWLSTH